MSSNNTAVQVPLKQSRPHRNPHTGIHRKRYADRYNSVREPLADCYEDEETVIQEDKTVINNVFSPNRTKHSARNGRKTTPYHRKLRALGITIAVLLFSWGTLAVLNNVPVRSQITPFILLGADVIAFDVLQFVGRMLSQKSRILIMISILLCLVSLYWMHSRIVLVAVSFSFLSLILTKKFNRFWMDSENWLLSDAVQRILINYPESAFLEAWNNYGKRESRTLCYELGFEIDDYILDGMIKPLFCLGYLDADRSNAKEENLLVEAVEVAEEAHKAMKILQAENEKLKEENEAYLKSENDGSEILRFYIAQAKELKAQLQQATEQKKEQPKKALEEAPEATQNEAETQPEENTEDPKEVATRLLLSGVGIKKTYEKSGYPYQKVYELGQILLPEKYGVKKKKDLPESGKEDFENKITIVA